jgi:hypothetical protein
LGDGFALSSLLEWAVEDRRDGSRADRAASPILPARRSLRRGAGASVEQTVLATTADAAHLVGTELPDIAIPFAAQPVSRRELPAPRRGQNSDRRRCNTRAVEELSRGWL